MTQPGAVAVRTWCLQKNTQRPRRRCVQLDTQHRGLKVRREGWGTGVLPCDSGVDGVVPNASRRSRSIDGKGQSSKLPRPTHTSARSRPCAS